MKISEYEATILQQIAMPCLRKTKVTGILLALSD
jgi:hypothetical protein